MAGPGRLNRGQLKSPVSFRTISDQQRPATLPDKPANSDALRPIWTIRSGSGRRGEEARSLSLADSHTHPVYAALHRSAWKSGARTDCWETGRPDYPVISASALAL